MPGWRLAVAAELDHNVCRLGRVRYQAGAVGVLPARHFDHLPGLVSVLGRHRRLDDMEAVGIDEEGVITEGPVQVRHRWMIVRDRLRLELAQGLLDPCGA